MSAPPPRRCRNPSGCAKPKITLSLFYYLFYYFNLTCRFRIFCMLFTNKIHCVQWIVFFFLPRYSKITCFGDVIVRPSNLIFYFLFFNFAVRLAHAWLTDSILYHLYVVPLPLNKCLTPDLTSLWEKYWSKEWRTFLHLCTFFSAQVYKLYVSLSKEPREEGGQAGGRRKQAPVFLWVYGLEVGITAWTTLAVY